MWLLNCGGKNLKKPPQCEIEAELPSMKESKELTEKKIFNNQLSAFHRFFFILKHFTYKGQKINEKKLNSKEINY